MVFEALFLISIIFLIIFLWFRSAAESHQNQGEALLSKTLKAQFASPDYHLLNHITLRLEHGTTQIDHILISRYGIFVIETKNYKGWIFANSKQPTWTQVLYSCKFRFQNPIFQNYKHVRAVQSLLDFLPSDFVQSLVVFVGQAAFKTEIPSGVYSLSGVIDYLRQQKKEVISLNRMHFCIGRIEAARLAITGDTDIEHVLSLRRRYNLKSRD